MGQALGLQAGVLPLLDASIVLPASVSALLRSGRKMPGPSPCRVAVGTPEQSSVESSVNQPGPAHSASTIDSSRRLVHGSLPAGCLHS